MSGETGGLSSKLEELHEEYSKTKYNKATDKHLGLLRAKMARLRREIAQSSSRRHGEGFFIKRGGDATVALVGFPSAGKSSLLNVLSNAKSKTAPYAFTTVSIIPGTMIYNEAHIQIFDTPGLIGGAHAGIGGGRSVIGALRATDLILFVIDINSVWQLGTLVDELKALSVYVGREKPRVTITESQSYPKLVVDVNKSGLSNKVVETVCTGFGMHNASVKLESELSEDELVSIVCGRAVYIRAIVALNKIDIDPNYASIARSIASRYGLRVVPVSATEPRNLDELRKSIYEQLNIITIYLEPESTGPREPMVLKQGSTIRDAANKIHTELINDLRCAYVTGPSSKFPRQRVGADHVLKNGDVVRFMKQR